MLLKRYPLRVMKFHFTLYGSSLSGLPVVAAITSSVRKPPQFNAQCMAREANPLRIMRQNRLRREWRFSFVAYLDCYILCALRIFEGHTKWVSTDTIPAE
jgi:hypothetical protein